MFILKRGWGWRVSHIYHYSHNKNEFKAEVITFIVTIISSSEKREETQRVEETERETKFTILLQSIFQLRLIFNTINSPWQQFSDYSVPQNYPEGLLKHQLLCPTHRVSNLTGMRWRQEFVFGTVLGDADILIKATFCEPLVHYTNTFDHWITPLLKWNTLLKIKKKKIVCLIFRDIGQPVWTV